MIQFFDFKEEKYMIPLQLDNNRLKFNLIFNLMLFCTLFPLFNAPYFEFCSFVGVINTRSAPQAAVP